MSKKVIPYSKPEKDGMRGNVPTRPNGGNDKVYNSYLDTLNPRDNMDVQFALASSKDGRFLEFLDRVRDGRYTRVNLATIAKACKIDLYEFTNWWNKAATQVAIAKAQHGSIAVTEDMIQDARSVQAECARCDGLTWIAAPANMPSDTPGYRLLDFTDPNNPKYCRTCPACQGSGKSRKPGDAHSRDKLLSMSGLIQTGKAAVQIVQNFGGQAHASAIPDLDDAMPMSMEDAINVDSEPIEDMD